jgi:hypothetical protein
MNANTRNSSKRYVSAILVVFVISAMILGLLPASAGSGQNQAAVSGTVTDINDGEPIEGALVVISYHDTEMSRITDENGMYSFMYVPECFCMKAITVTKNGYRPESEEFAISGVMVLDFELLIMELEPYPGSISGIVTDYHDGKPLQGVQIVLAYHETFKEVYTDSDGRYEIGQVPECFCLKKVTATLEHFRPETREVAVQGVTVVDFELWIEEQSPNPDGTVRGMVMDAETGEPIIGALVMIGHDGVTVAETYTGERGQYIITGIDLCRCLKDISVSADGYEPQSGSIAVDEDTVVDFLLEPEEGNDDVVPLPVAREAPKSMRDRPYAMAGLTAASVGIAAMGYYAFMARE